jgi:hypothetical protein
MPGSVVGGEQVECVRLVFLGGQLWRTQVSQLSECLSDWSGIGAIWKRGFLVAVADVGCIGGPVSGRGALPGDGDRDVDAEHPGEYRGGQVGGELEQRGRARLPGSDTDLAEAFGQTERADGRPGWPPGNSQGEVP